MGISLRLNDEEMQVVKEYAASYNISVSELFRNAVMEKIEDEIDIELYKTAINEYKNNPETYTLEDVERELGLK